MVRIGTHSSILRLTKLALTCLLLLIAFPSIATSQIEVDIPNAHAGDYNLKEPVRELPQYILQNCFSYVKYRYPNTPPTAVIKANLQATGTIGFMYSNGYEHYVVVEEDYGDTLLISDTNFYKTKSTRVIKRSAFVGFYSL